MENVKSFSMNLPWMVLSDTIQLVKVSHFTQGGMTISHTRSLLTLVWFISIHQNFIQLQCCSAITHIDPPDKYKNEDKRVDELEFNEVCKFVEQI